MDREETAPVQMQQREERLDKTPAGNQRAIPTQRTRLAPPYRTLSYGESNRSSLVF